MVSRHSNDIPKRLSRRLFLGGTAAAAAAAALAVESSAQAATTSEAASTGPVRIDTGLIEGVAAALPGVTVFKGIPFAATTAGANRWRPPRPAPSWSGVYTADTFGDICPQTSLSGSAIDVPMSEDCLNLNVWTAATSPGDRRPVFVWIYGGRFVGGYGSMAEFDGSGLARKDLVVVTLSYRTASYGFLSTPELSEEQRRASGNYASGNYGLLDQVAALQWVRRNIAAFGGDPGNVTIAGQSAGSASVLNHVFSPLTKGLFHRAILESGAFYPKDSQIGALATSYRTQQHAEALGTEWLTTVGVSTIAEARALSTDALLTGLADNDSAIATVASIDGYPPVWRPVLDGWVMPLSYWDTMITGSQSDVPILNGNNENENGADPDLSVTEAAFQTWAGTYYTPLSEEFLDLYPVTSDAEGGPQTIQATDDRDRVSAHDWAVLWAQHAKSPVYTYYWTHAVPGQDQGAYHGSEINYVFDNLYDTDDPWTAADCKIANTLSDYVVNFAKSGDPNGSGLPRWEPTNAKDQTVMELGDSWEPVSIATPDRAAFYRRFFSLQPPW